MLFRSDYEIFVIDNGSVLIDITSEHIKITKPKYSQNFLGHVNQQEYLMNDFYDSIKEDNILIYFIDDDEYIIENESLKGNTYLNWKIWNGRYHPNTYLNTFFKPIVLSNQNISLKIHSIIFKEEKHLPIYDGNGSIIDEKVSSLSGSFKNYIEHHQYDSIENFNKRLSIRPYYEESDYFKIRLKGFWECCPIPLFQMCIIMDNYDRINILRKIYPRITFFICSSIIPEGGDIEVVPIEYWICPEQYIFKYAQENCFNIIIKKASKIKTKIIDINDEYKDINIYKTIHHYPILSNSKKIVKKYKQFGYFDYLDIVQMNEYVLKLNTNYIFESKSFLIEFERIKSKDIDESIGINMFVDLLKSIH